MVYRRLFLWVEGQDDRRFFERIMKPLFLTCYESVDIIEYSRRPKEYVEKYITSIKAMRADYLVVCDFDRATCVTACKERTLGRFPGVDIERFIVVVQEIESWYLAGIESKRAQSMKLSRMDRTDDITKERFETLIPRGYVKIAFMQEILNDYSVETACGRNVSFAYFVRKFFPQH